MALRRVLALAWLAAFAAAALWLAWRLPSARLETSVFELVPWQAPDPAAGAGAEAVRAAVERRFTVLVGARDPAAAVRAADAYAGVLRGLSGAARVVCALPPGMGTLALAAYAPHRRGLLCAADRADLATGGSGLLRAAEEGLALPSGAGGPLGFGLDPFGTFGRWLASAAALSGRLRPRDGRLEIQADGRTWVAVSAEAAGGDEAARHAFGAGLERAAAAAKAQGAEGLVRSGFIFHELAAAAQARREVAAVGALSTGLLALLLAAVFRRPGPMLLALLPAAVGCVAGAAAVLLLWTRVHAVALVFGSTVVGVADDYGLYFLSGLYDGDWDSGARGRAALGPLALAMATSVLAYLVLGFLPIPALRQVALFAAVGLAADWAGVVLWYPTLAARLAAPPARAVERAAALRRGWPRWGGRRLSLVLLVGLGLACWGCLRVRVSDDVRQLYAHDAALDREQARAQAWTGLGGAGGFFVVSAPTAQEALRRQEALRDALAAAGAPAWTAVSVFVPSLARQASDQGLQRRALFGPPRLAARLAGVLGDPGWPGPLRRRWERPAPAWTPERWLEAPVSAPFRWLWITRKDGSVVSLVLPGPDLGQSRVESLAALAARVPGVEYVDQLRSVGRVLGALRRLLGWVLLAGAAGVFGALALRLGPAAGAAMLPTLAGALAGLAALGFAGLPLNLFALLALLLLLGTAVDFGIYLHDGRPALSSFVAVQVAALTNIAAVGVLAFSGTPALRGFGLVLGVGCLVAWLLAPCGGRRPDA